MQALRTRYAQAVAQDAAIQASIRHLDQDDDATGDAASHPLRDKALNPEHLRHELEDFLRQEREGRAE